MNAVTKTEGTALSVTMGFNDLASFEFMQRTAKMFSASTMVPTAYQAMVTKGYGDRAQIEPNPAAISNCMIALDMSQRMNANPLMIMQNLHIIEGRPSWSSQFFKAVAIIKPALRGGVHLGRDAGRQLGNQLVARLVAAAAHHGWGVAGVVVGGAVSQPLGAALDQVLGNHGFPFG